jgi:hypothetical protein
MCKRAVLTNRPSLDLSPFVLEGRRACRGAWDRSGAFLNPDSCMGFEPGPSKKGSWMMAQNDLVVAGIDVAKDKVDVCIRSLSLKRAFANTQEGRRELASWLRRRKVGKTVMEASGGYEREWAKALRATKIEVRIVDPKRVRSIAMPRMLFAPSSREVWSTLASLPWMPPSASCRKKPASPQGAGPASAPCMQTRLAKPTQSIFFWRMIFFRVGRHASTYRRTSNRHS